jgi:hypothetical protein
MLFEAIAGLKDDVRRKVTMSKTKLLSGAAACGLGWLSIGAAYGADLPIAEPVEYVRICDAFGSGFYYIPGTDTCLRISGRIRVEAHYVEEDNTGSDFNNSTTRARAYLRLDSRTQTDLGLVRTYFDFKLTLGPSDFATNYSSSHAIDHAFIQLSNDWGVFTAGIQDSYFDAPFASNTFGTRVGIDDPTTSNATRGTVFAYTHSFGSVSTTLSVEDPASNGRRKEGPLDDYEGQELLDVVGNIRYDGDWGSALISGVVGQIHDINGDGFGWAINGGFNASFGIIGAGLTLGYADGRIGYVTLDPGGAGDFDGPDGSDTNKAWSIRGGLSVDLTPELAAYVDASWTEVDTDSGALDYDFWAIAADLQWTPIPGLLIGPEVAYTSLEPDVGGDTQAWGAMWRIQRDF